MPRSFREIGNICDTSDRQRLMRFVDEHSYLIPIHTKVKDKYVLRYHIPIWPRDFFFDPNRSQCLYSTSLVIDKCQRAIKNLILDTTPDSYNDGLIHFFTLTPTLSGGIPIANATHMLESARHGPHRSDLLFFLEYLSEIDWFNIYHSGQGPRHLTNGIVHWVCTTLVG